MVVAIHQPNYIPYLGYFYKIIKADTFVFLDDAQYSNDSITNWNLIKTSGGTTRLKIPVEQHLGDKICEVRPKDELGWKKKHLRTLEMNYKKAPFFNEVFGPLSDILNVDYKNIACLNETIILWLLNCFGIHREIVMSSKMDIQTTREERILDIVSSLGGDVYYSGKGAAVYQNPDHYAERGIKLEYTDYQSTPYRQLWKGDFIPNLSVLDYVMNCGFDPKIFAQK